MIGQRAHSKIQREKWNQDPGSWPPSIWLCLSVLKVQFLTPLSPNPVYSPNHDFMFYFFSLLNLFLTAGYPPFSPSPPNPGQLVPNFFCWGLLKTRCCCLFTLSSGQAASFLRFCLSSGQQILISNTPHDIAALYSSGSFRTIEFLFPFFSHQGIYNLEY